MKGRLKRIAQTTAALTPLVLGAASPAYGCMVVPASDQAAQNGKQINSGPVGNGPTAPWDTLQRIDQRAPGVTCPGEGPDEEMCIAGNWRDTPAGSK